MLVFGLKITDFVISILRFTVYMVLIMLVVITFQQVCIYGSGEYQCVSKISEGRIKDLRTCQFLYTDDFT